MSIEREQVYYMDPSLVSSEDDFANQISYQSNANPMPMQVAFPFLLREQVIYWDPTTGLDGGWFQQTMFHKSEHVANPMSMHLAVVFLSFGTSIYEEDY